MQERHTSHPGGNRQVQLQSVPPVPVRAAARVEDDQSLCHTARGGDEQQMPDTTLLRRRPNQAMVWRPSREALRTNAVIPSSEPDRRFQAPPRRGRGAFRFDGTNLRFWRSRSRAAEPALTLVKKVAGGRSIFGR